MKNILVLSLLALPSFLIAQHKDLADAAVGRGVPYHDKGDYEGAIKRYDSALALDKDNLMALAEKSYTLLTMEKYDASIDCCERAIKKHPGDPDLKMLYVTYGTNYDYKKKTDKSLEIYDEGIKLFPDFYLLYFNKGITLSSVDRSNEAEACFQKALLLDPYHAGSNNALARILYDEHKRTQSLMAFCRFLVLEPQTDRAKENVGYMQKVLDGNVEKKSPTEITINVDAASLDTNKKENNFGMVDMMMSMGAAVPLDSLDKSPVAKFAYRLTTVISTLASLKSKNHGFYWDFYAPYFIEMKEKNYVETFSHIAFASTDDKDNADWLHTHKNEIDAFYDWSKAFVWKQK